MGYVYLMMVALFFSFGGTCVKMIKPYFDPSMITFMRFFVGVLWLLLLKAVKHQSFRSDFRASLRSHWKWLIFGALSKFASYMAENTALHGKLGNETERNLTRVKKKWLSLYP